MVWCTVLGPGLLFDNIFAVTIKVVIYEKLAKKYRLFYENLLCTTCINVYF